MRIMYIPTGPKNLAGIFTDINFALVEEYYVTLPGVMQSNNFTIKNGCDDSVRLVFMNYLGACADAVTFCKQDITHEATSTLNQSPGRYPRVMAAQSITRSNVASNDTYTVVTDYIDEDGQQWLDELFDTGAAWMQVDGSELQQDDYVAITILDQKTQKFKNEGRYDYQTTIQFKLSNERITVRNNPGQVVFKNTLVM